MKKNLYQSPIDSKDGDELKEQISSLISRHNVLCAIERVFDNNPIASEAFEEAAKEVHDNNNQSFANIFVILRLWLKRLKTQIMPHAQTRRR